MQDELNTISPDHQDKLAQQFEYINDLIANDNIEKAVELLLELHYADLADFLDNVNRKYYHIIFPAIASMLNSEVLVWLEELSFRTLTLTLTLLLLSVRRTVCGEVSSNEVILHTL